MAEQWTKVEGTDDYEVKDIVLIRKVNRIDLEEKKLDLQNQISNLQAEIDKTNADIAKIDELEA